eukprot:TRINITY_DN2888_c0_g2_i1.p1 TRINITY_DN2888_c0_g2~~TRINITY_DN2888_c0_g2_i1.p1  ORF type:complete len:862 (+),score=136.27 TRINITY_DN2888_c0_g2_i1:118-2703(+)
MRAGVVACVLGGAAALLPPPNPKWTVPLPHRGYTRIALAQWGGRVRLTATDCDEYTCADGGRTVVAVLDDTGDSMSFCQLGEGAEVTASPGGVATAPVQQGNHTCTVTAGGSKSMLVCHDAAPGRSCGDRWVAYLRDGHGAAGASQITQPLVYSDMFAFSVLWPGQPAIQYVWRMGASSPASSDWMLNFSTLAAAPNATVIGAPRQSDRIGTAMRWQWVQPAGDPTAPLLLRETERTWSRVDGTAIGPRGGLQPVVCGAEAFFVVRHWVPPGEPHGTEEEEGRYVVAMNLAVGLILWWYPFPGSDHPSLTCDGLALYVSDREAIGVTQGAMWRLVAGDLPLYATRRVWLLPDAAGMPEASLSAPVLGPRKDVVYLVSVSQQHQLLRAVCAKHGVVLWQRRWSFTEQHALSVPVVVPSVAVSDSTENATVYIGLRNGSVAAFPDLLPSEFACKPAGPPDTHRRSVNWVLVSSVVSASASVLLLVLWLYCRCRCQRWSTCSDAPASRYHFGHELGRGAFGCVYLAWEKNAAPDRRVHRAIKLIDCSHDNKRVVSALREFEVMVRLRKHPHIMTPIETFWLYDQDNAKRHDQANRDIPMLHSRRYALIVMEYYPHGDLKALVNRRRPFKEDEVMDFAMQLASALDFLHSLKTPLVHRDLKPENILVRDFRDGAHLVVTDFGLAKVLERSVAHAASTCLLPAGTLWTMSPEHFYDGYTGVEIDLWSLGCVLYAVANGRVNTPPDHPLETPGPTAADRVPESTYAQVLFRRADRSAGSCFQYGIFREMLVEGYSTRLAGLVASLLSPNYGARPGARHVMEYVTRRPCLCIHELWCPGGPAGGAATSPSSGRGTPTAVSAEPLISRV